MCGRKCSYVVELIFMHVWTDLSDRALNLAKDTVCYPTLGTKVLAHYYDNKKGDNGVQTWHVLTTLVVHKVTVAGKGSDG